MKKEIYIDTVPEWAAYLRNFAEVNEPFVFENEEKMQKVWELLGKKQKKFKKSENMIWRFEK